MTADKQVQIREEKRRGRATIIHVGVYEPGRHGLSLKREFYGVRQRKQAEEHAAWLRHCIELAAAARASGAGVRQTCLVDVTDGVVRWKSNGRVPFTDKLVELAGQGLVFSLARSVEARKADDQAFLSQARLLPRDDSGEAQFERRAAFGPGQAVVDVITGHTYQT